MDASLTTPAAPLPGAGGAPARASVGGEGIGRLPLYFAVGLVAAAVIALQLAIMRIFSVGSWAHFGSLVIALAMLGFGLTSAVMCVATKWFERHWQGVTTATLILFCPLAVAANLVAQQVPFNAIFLVSDPAQKWRLAANFVLYLMPFLAGAAFLGTVFLRSATNFGRVYFADLVGAGLGGLVLLLAMTSIGPQHLITVPLILWVAGGLVWFAGHGNRRGLAGLAVAAVVSFAAHAFLPGALDIPRLAVSDYKGVSYARKFPDAQQVFRNVSPFGDIEVYGSSYLHFAPGLSDNAAFNLPQVPENAYLGLYVDGEGPQGIMRDLPDADTAYFRFLPMVYPYLLKQEPETFVVQFGGGISTMVALRNGSKSVTVAESNPAVLDAFLTSQALRDFTGDVLHNPRITVVPREGRLFLGATDQRYDIIDLSLADSAGLSNPGGFSVVEKYAYTTEAMTAYMRALRDGGVLSVTLWNKEEPPKSVLKLYATMVAAAREAGVSDVGNSFFAVSSYLATTTVLYKAGGFTEAEVALLRDHTRAMSFDEIWSPGFVFDPSGVPAILAAYRDQFFGDGATSDPMGVTAADPTLEPGLDPLLDPALSAVADPLLDNLGGDDPAAGFGVLPATTLGRAAWYYLVNGGWGDIAKQYVFDVRPLTNDRPYFAAYVKPGDLPKITDRLDLFQDEWGYLLLWATLGIAAIGAAVLVLFPVVFGWRTIFSRTPGKLGTILYFACLGLGYIMVEVGLVAKMVVALTNPTVSASLIITGMLVFSGLGSLVSERILPRVRRSAPLIFLGIGVLLLAYAWLLDPVLGAIGGLPYWLRLVLCMALVAPPAFLMGFPMPTAMTSLGRLGKDSMFIWAWGINGCFSVIGAAIVPLVSTSFGLSAVLEVSAAAYLIALPAFFAVLLPFRRATTPAPT